MMAGARAVGWRTVVWRAVVDVVVVVVAMLAMLSLRFEFDIPGHELTNSLRALAVAIAAQLLAGTWTGLYRRRFITASFEETTAIVRACVLATVTVAVANLTVLGRAVPLSVSIGYGAVAVLGIGGTRWIWRARRERGISRTSADAKPLIVVGAGEAAAQLVGQLRRKENSPFRPVALLDDDPAKRKLRIQGIPVVGTSHDVVEVARAHDARSILIAIPSAGAAVLREMTERAEAAGLTVLVLPSVVDLFGGNVRVGDIRPVTEEDLLGRGAAEIDIDAIADYLTGRRVLVTGAGGSIGSELCRQVHRFAPAALVMLDRDESALHGVELSITGRATLDQRNLVVCDIRDVDRLDAVFSEHRPEVVFHAAALKHLPLLEMHPCEAMKSNCTGTLNVLRAATAHGVERFVNISTDKAADPTSVLGRSKRVAERITAAWTEEHPGSFVSVRFGNVLGSRGSVLTTFRTQVANGGPITVTDPDVSRYFMTVEEAVRLVIQAGALDEDGDALVLDMGAPVRIDDVARRLAGAADRPVDIVYTGLRPGEKLHEQLLASHETGRRTRHPLITRVPVPPLLPRALDGLDLTRPPDELRATLEALLDDEPTAATPPQSLGVRTEG